jgi:hypothetical protein
LCIAPFTSLEALLAYRIIEASMASSRVGAPERPRPAHADAECDRRSEWRGSVCRLPHPRCQPRLRPGVHRCKASRPARFRLRDTFRHRRAGRHQLRGTGLSNATQPMPSRPGNNDDRRIAVPNHRAAAFKAS